MPKSRDNSQITSADWESARVELNFLLQRINDRLDAMEGLRGSLQSESGGSFQGRVVVTDDDGTELHSMS